MTTMQIDLCVNDPNNGNSTGMLWAIQFDNVIHLESNFIPDPDVRCYRCDDHHVKIGRRKFPIIGYAFWVGNWCWDTITVTVATANEILAYIQSLRLHDRQKFGVESAQEDVNDDYELGRKIDLNNYLEAQGWRMWT